MCHIISKMESHNSGLFVHLYTFVKVMNNYKVGRECTSSFSIVASAMVRTSSCTSKWKSCVKIKGKRKEHKEFKIKGIGKEKERENHDH